MGSHSLGPAVDVAFELTAVMADKGCWPGDAEAPDPGRGRLRRATWVNDLMGKLRSGGYGRVRALVWFDQGTWQLDGNPTVLSAVRNLMSVLG